MFDFTELMIHFAAKNEKIEKVKYFKGDLIRCRYKLMAKDFTTSTEIGIGIVIWHRNNHCMIILNTGLKILSHTDDMELMAKGNLVK